MSKVVSTKRSRQKEKSKGTGQFGVADADPQELDVRRTRRGTYPVLGAPTGTTWRNFVQKYGERKRTSSPSSQFQTTSTEAMDTDEAQKVTTEIVKVLIEKQEQEKEKVSPMVVDEEEETMATMEEIEQNLKEKKQKKEMEEFLVSTKQPLDDSVISFKSIDSGVDDRAEMTEENLEDTIVYKDQDKRPDLEEIEFEQIKEPEETLTEQLNKKKSVQCLYNMIMSMIYTGIAYMSTGQLHKQWLEDNYQTNLVIIQVWYDNGLLTADQLTE